MSAVNESVVFANQLLKGDSIDSKSLLILVSKLKKQRSFGLARQVLEIHIPILAREDENYRRLVQQLSLCTYKDPDLNPSDRLDQALKILQGIDELDLKSRHCSKDQEILGQVGAIYKRKWDVTNQTSHLEMARAYYSKGYSLGVAGDYGYTAINAAFVLDLLAELDIDKSEGDGKRKKARQFREEIITILPALAEQADHQWLKQEWWFLTTLAEALFGLHRYKEAETWLLQATQLETIAEWEWESTSRQLAKILQLQNSEDIEAKSVLENFLGPRAAGLKALLRGKIGLGLSGGGFRASLFHIGMLARLAELDLLRDVEYLSCVSGGSIIGAYYYLEVRNLLQAKADHEISRQDYIDIVKRVETNFLAGVQTNIRVQVLSDLTANFKMIFGNDYSTTNRLAELYESNLYSRIKPLDTNGQPSAEPNNKDKVFILSELTVQPKGEAEGFNPKYQNWRRAAKIPILVLNATPLNTGHNWQFTATWMGEPPAESGTQVDITYRFRRLYHSAAPKPHDKLRLGSAVAASSCVPGLFTPLPLKGLYPDKVVRLVDGGVHDNQGTAALLEQGCNVLLISDASGQMDALDDPGTGLLDVPLRTTGILQARLRTSQFKDLDDRRRSGLLQGLMFIHLKEGLEAHDLDWCGCDNPSAQTTEKEMHIPVDREVQKKLAAIRTDLDSFSDVEAYALMNSAYEMTKQALPKALPEFGTQDNESIEANIWKFRELAQAMAKGGAESALMKQLNAGDKLALKVWFLNKNLKMLGILILAVLIGGLGYFGYLWWNLPFSLTWGQILTTLFLTTLTYTALKPLVILIDYRKTLGDILTGLGMVFFGAWLAKIHLKIFDKLFLAQGTLEKLKNH